jgi:hypothetical protein
MKYRLWLNRVLLKLILKLFTKYRKNREELKDILNDHKLWNTQLEQDNFKIKDIEAFLIEKLKASKRGK